VGGVLTASIFSIIPFPMFLSLLVMAMGMDRLRIPKECWHPLIIFFIILIYVILLNRELYIYGYIRAWLMPIVIFCAIKNCNLTKTDKFFVLNILFLFMICNFFVSYIERIVGQHLLLTNIDNINAEERGISYEFFEFRSNGLLGHPLSCGQFTSLFLSFILISRCGHQFKMWFSIFAFIAMLCFNVRFSLVTCIISFVIYIIYNYKGSKNKLLFFFSFVIITLICLYILYYTGLGGRLMNLGLYGNDDSSLARTDILAIFDYLDINAIIWGSDNSSIVKAMYRSGTEGLIIENPFVVYTLGFGVILTIL